MSSLTGGPASEGIGRAGDAGGYSSAPGSMPASQQSQQPTASRVRTPRDVMDARQAREARRRAEEEAARQEQQRRIDIERRRSAERRAAVAQTQAQVQAQVRDSGYRSVQSSSGRTPQMQGYSAARPGAPIATPQDRSSSTYSTQPVSGEYQTPQAAPRTTPAGATSAPEPQPQPQTQYSQQYQPDRGQSLPQQQQQQPQSSQMPSGGEGPSQARPNQSSFPHAFERWETLSSHWEGLTSYWIRKLEMNTDTIRRENDITREQMARQITDLSAAGANLFHAVVELQRLRASSERKFQRWFFETRARQEQDKEDLKKLEAELDRERRERSNMISAGAQSDLERRQAEMKRELQIAKDEARRAWEELGRREQEERDRQLALREGHPIFVGGVQVLPMSAVSRGGSVQQRPQTQDPSFASPPVGGDDEQEFELQEPSPTDTDPFTTQEPRQAQASQPIRGISSGAVPLQPMMGGSTQSPQAGPSRSPGAFYQQPATLLHESAQAQGSLSQPAYDDREQEVDPPIPEFDTEGIPIAFRPQAATGGPVPSTLAPSSSAAPQAGLYGGSTIRTVPQEQSSEGGGSDDEFDMAFDAAREREQMARIQQAQQQSQQQSSSQASSHTRSSSDPADYTGEGFGSGSGWEALPRHQHPTRLSDVVEEDERSRHSHGSGGGTTQH